MGKKIVIQHMSRQTQEFKIHFNCVFYFVQCFDSNSLPECLPIDYFICFTFTTLYRTSQRTDMKSCCARIRVLNFVAIFRIRKFSFAPAGGICLENNMRMRLQRVLIYPFST